MFNDERINTESGKIYQRGILYATLVTLMYGTLHGIYLAVTGHFRIAYLYTELAIVLCGTIILIVGAVRFPRGGDERSVFEKHSYFLGAGKVFIVAALAGYAVTIPFSRDKSFGDMPINHVILLLEVLGYVYFFYAFKTRGIPFNYTVIAESKRDYYIAVFSNIGKLAGALFVAFAFAGILDLGVNQSFWGFLGILGSWLASVVGLGLEYLFLSWIEKRSYDEEDSERLKSGTVIVAVFLIGITVFTSLLQIVGAFLVKGNLSAFSNVGTVLASVSYALRYAGYAQSALTAMVLCHLLAQTGNRPKTRRAVAWILGLSVFSILYQTATSFFTMTALPFLEQSSEPYVINRLMEGINGVSELASLAGIGLKLWLAHSLVKEVGVSKVLLLAPALEIAMFLADLFFSSQSMTRTSAILNAIVTLAALLIAFAVLNTHKFSPMFEESEAE